ncbi:hypothetical protein GCM10009118_12230 [Wandonia haliotis]|uniref:DUF4249 domain-containing protein n=1 Tax=Wandonia haliotis TaxID=574963 RepID=A0ABN1MNB8_9FLAO
MRSNYILFWITAFLLLACEKEVKLDLPEFQQKIVVDGRIEPGMPPIVVLTRSQDLYAPTDINALQNNFVKNAIITVDDGTNEVVLDEFCMNNLQPELIPVIAAAIGVSEETLQQLNFCAYSTFDPNFFGQVGKTYGLTIEVEGSTYTSSTKIIDPPVLDSVYFKLNGELEEHGFGWILINDNPTVYNTYFLEMRRIHQNSAGEPADSRFLPAFGPVFDDEFFNGLVFDFGFGNMGSYEDNDIPDEFKGYFKTGDTVVVRISSMDYAAYEFMKIKYIQDSNGGNPFASPANAPTNIQGGALGAWVGFSPLLDTLACYPQ